MGDWDHADAMDLSHWDDDYIPPSPNKVNVDVSWIEDTCPHCGADLILPTGKRDSVAMLLIDEPFDSDYLSGTPFTGPFGAVIDNELLFIKIRMRDLRRASLWLHKPNKQKECFEYGVARVLQESSQRGVILLIGAETVKYFTGKSVDAVSGLVVQSDYLPAQVLVACPSPKTVFSSSVGEIRLALRKFKQEMEDYRNS